MTEPHDPNSIPMLTDVIVPGRPPVGRPAQTPAEESTPSAQPAQAHAEGPAQSQATPTYPAAQAPAAGAGGASATPAVGFDARDVEFIAERLRGRLSTYLREDARRVIEARCRDAVEEHTNWLVRQVTREVDSALEAEVAGWVRDAVREELARHTSER